MNYSNHSLRTDLQEWKNRLSRAPDAQFGNQLKYILNKFDKNLQIKGLILEAINKYAYSNEDLDIESERINSRRELEFESEIHQVAHCYQVLKYIISKNDSYNLHNYGIVLAGNSEARRKKIIDDYISPIVYYLHDKLDKSNSTIYLLEKYKRRTEWFTKKELFKKYNTAEKSYEQIFEDDLRLFLFDQGIDYPFSTPASASGRPDIIGSIETDDPLVIEIKIFDRDKGYGKNRIKDGFNQIVKYTNDYNKNIGYLVIYNMDTAELNFSFVDKSNFFPPSMQFNNKTFFFVVVNLAMDETASKGKIEEIEITEKYLTNK